MTADSRSALPTGEAHWSTDRKVAVARAAFDESRRAWAQEWPIQIDDPLDKSTRINDLAGRMEVALNYLCECVARSAAPSEGAAPHPDTVRLDWLDAHREDEVSLDNNGDPQLDYHYWQTRGQCSSIRDAIDNDERRTPKPDNQ